LSFSACLAQPRRKDIDREVLAVRKYRPHPAMQVWAAPSSTTCSFPIATRPICVDNASGQIVVNPNLGNALFRGNIRARFGRKGLLWGGRGRSGSARRVVIAGLEMLITFPHAKFNSLIFLFLLPPDDRPENSKSMLGLN